MAGTNETCFDNMITKSQAVSENERWSGSEDICSDEKVDTVMSASHYSEGEQQ